MTFPGGVFKGWQFDGDFEHGQITGQGTLTRSADYSFTRAVESGGNGPLKHLPPNITGIMARWTMSANGKAACAPVSELTTTTWDT